MVAICRRPRFGQRSDSNVWPGWVGAGRGNRTLVFSLEGYGSTIELYPRGRGFSGSMEFAPEGLLSALAVQHILAADAPNHRIFLSNPDDNH